MWSYQGFILSNSFPDGKTDSLSIRGLIGWMSREHVDTVGAPKMQSSKMTRMAELHIFERLRKVESGVSMGWSQTKRSPGAEDHLATREAALPSLRSSARKQGCACSFTSHSAINLLAASPDETQLIRVRKKKRRLQNIPKTTPHRGVRHQGAAGLPDDWMWRL